ncbi:N-acetyltransferase [Pedobacter sp. HMWF019]|uniref:GNAT family N-acetyltransferase n=1 Tax=Pedobacter sp. HMWF019 TaxID=2056856 RepID=UPI000D3C57FD|nr:GNAT family protein [Pedobacter sp. HMWF019]PTS95975.1 N-acetyltransferase [Pedobacter sp. HMWF019]
MEKISNNMFLAGNNIYLRGLEEKDVDGNYSIWLNDPDITSFNSHGRFPMTKNKLKDYVNHTSGSHNMLVLAVIDKETETHIGNISLQGINWIDRNAEIAFLLGEKAYWGKGVMYEAGALILDHAFTVLNLHRIYCGTSSENIGMQKLALKLGMEQEGIRKEAIYKQGEYHDIIEYGLLSLNYKKQ